MDDYNLKGEIENLKNELNQHKHHVVDIGEKGKQMIGIIMFFASLVMLLYGFPVAFTFAAVSLFFGIISGIVEVGFEDGFVTGLLEGVQEGFDMFDFMPF